jgi:hypothetical protein
MSFVACLVHTWITRVTVSAHIIAWYILHEVLQGLFVPRLLALAHHTRHDDRFKCKKFTRMSTRNPVSTQPSFQCNRLGSFVGLAQDKVDDLKLKYGGRRPERGCR